MPVMDEFKEERQALKHGTPRQKLGWFWDYYKWHTVIALFLLLLILSVIFQAASRKDTALYALLLNGNPRVFLSDDAANTAAFAEYAGIDESKYQILYDTSVQIGTGTGNEYVSAQKLMAYVAAAELDVILSDPDSLLPHAYRENFQDLRDFLSPQQLEQYQDRFYYIDRAITEEQAAANAAGNYDYAPAYGDPHRPEEMRDPVPAGIFLPPDCALLKDYYFQGSEAVASVLINTKRPETASVYIDFLMQSAPAP